MIQNVVKFQNENEKVSSEYQTQFLRRSCSISFQVIQVILTCVMFVRSWNCFANKIIWIQISLNRILRSQNCRALLQICFRKSSFIDNKTHRLRCLKCLKNSFIVIRKQTKLCLITNRARVEQFSFKWCVKYLVSWKVESLFSYKSSKMFERFCSVLLTLL